MKLDTKRNAYTVLVASILFNMTIQVLYVWSLLKVEKMAPFEIGGWQWSSQEGGLPYTLAIIFFSIGVLIGGRVQDKIGPRWVATVGGAMVGIGLAVSGLAGNNPMGATIGYGVITGLGIGFGYGSVLPACLKWFSPRKKGLIGGLVLGGFGLASVHYAFITTALLDNFDIEKTLLYIGIAVSIISVTAAQFVRNPSAEYSLALTEATQKTADTQKSADTQPTASNAKPAIDFDWKRMLKTKRFYLIFILFLFSVSMGLMIIGNMARISSLQAGITNAAFLISLVAVMNAVGRILGGMLSDKIGRVNTLFIAIVLQMINMIGFVYYQNPLALTLGFVFVGLCFGTFLAVFPALTADQYGLKNYGLNYGIVYLAYGFAGVAAPMVADFFYDRSGGFNNAYLICAAMMALMLGINFILKQEIKQNYN